MYCGDIRRLEGGRECIVVTYEGWREGERERGECTTNCQCVVVHTHTVIPLGSIYHRSVCILYDGWIL